MDLFLNAQGVRGGDFKLIGSKAAVRMQFAPNCDLYIDNYTGQGKTYKKREEPLFNIIHEGKPIFMGNYTELINKLRG